MEAISIQIIIAIMFPDQYNKSDYYYILLYFFMLNKYKTIILLF